MADIAAHQIRATFDRETITVYQAFRPAIAEPALKHQTFVPPFSFNRMTWIKPSYLWLMARTNWVQRSGQFVLAVRIHRDKWEQALGEAVLTSYVPGLDRDPEAWEQRFAKARVHVQWDPEYTLRGGKCQHRSIQVGVSRHLIRAYAEQWIVSIEDLTPLTRKIQRLRSSGKHREARRLLPNERVYPMPKEIGRGIQLSE